MQFSAKSILPSPVSACDVPDLFPSPSRLFDQYDLARNDSAAPSEPAKISISVAKVVITTNGTQEAASVRESDLIEKLLVRWCNASRIEIGD